jgi:uncharacterized protein YcbK (DUF882 family)
MFLGSALSLVAAAMVPRPLLAGLGGSELPGALPADARRIAFLNTHTGETLETVYFAGGRYLDHGLAEVNHILRDHRTGEIAPIDPELLDTLHLLQAQVGGKAAYELISGYRSSTTNEALRRHSNSVARHSLHLKGMAADVRLPGVSLSSLRDAALDLRRGGVGYYPTDAFIHVDTGRVRRW